MLACWYKRLALLARLATTAKIARARCLAVTINLRCWRKRIARRRVRTFVRETNWSFRIRAARVTYLRRVRVLQNLIRARSACTAARLVVLRRLWDDVERERRDDFARDAAEAAAEARSRRDAFLKTLLSV